MHRMQGTKRGWSLAAPAIGFALASMVATEADARGIMIINTGEDVMKIADIDPQMLSELDIDGKPEIGVMYSRFGLFWLDIVRWNPQYVIFMDDGFDGFSYEEVPEEELALLAGVDKLEKPTRYYLPPGGVLLGLLVVIGVPLVARSVIADNKRREALMADPRYLAAFNQYESDFETPDGERFEKAVATLVEQGVPDQEGRPNLWFLCGLDDDDE